METRGGESDTPLASLKTKKNSPVIPVIVLAFRAKARARRALLAQMTAFTLDATECSVEGDREHVEALVEDAFGTVGRFETIIRTELLSEVSRRYESTTSFSLAALPFFPLALTCVADVLGCDGQDSCATAARLYGFGDDARAFVLANALAWVQIIMCSWTVFPFIFFALARTERLPRRVRTAAGAVVVLSAYGCWALVSGVGSFLSILAIGTGGPWATACVAWFAGVASWNHYLFRPPRYHGSNN